MMRNHRHCKCAPVNPVGGQVEWKASLHLSFAICLLHFLQHDMRKYMSTRTLFSPVAFLSLFASCHVLFAADRVEPPLAKGDKLMITASKERPLKQVLAKVKKGV
jgi:hypothetical protein